ncbi:hypothetical protein [Trueperella sp. LYQ141]|uniref:hypothetical protein n=1 Tax=Trueperella sp. LYQ141 TaxID=3391058 RepID=UPI003982DABC
MANPFIDLFAPDTDTGQRWFWATVASVNPLRVREDGAAAPLGTTPRTLVALTPGDRVLCLRVGRRLIVMGKMGGGPPPEVVSPTQITINGKTYNRFGFQSLPSFGFGYMAPLAWAKIRVPFPFTPPSGWGFHYEVVDSASVTFVSSYTSQKDASGTWICIWQLADQDASKVKKLRWELVPA